MSDQVDNLQQRIALLEKTNRELLKDKEVVDWIQENYLRLELRNGIELRHTECDLRYYTKVALDKAALSSNK